MFKREYKCNSTKNKRLCDNGYTVREMCKCDRKKFGDRVNCMKMYYMCEGNKFVPAKHFYNGELPEWNPVSVKVTFLLTGMTGTWIQVKLQLAVSVGYIWLAGSVVYV